MATNCDIIGVILAGGQSTRMGTDKATLAIAGQSMLERTARTLLQVCPNIFIVGRDHPPADWPYDLAKTPFLPDRGQPHAGPIAGIITAIEHTHQLILLLGCDLPLLRADTLRQLLAAHKNAAATLAVTRDESGKVFAQPTLAIYTPPILSRLHEMLRTNRKSLQLLLQEKSVQQWPVPADKLHELLNVNDPASLAMAQQQLAAPANSAKMRPT